MTHRIRLTLIFTLSLFFAGLSGSARGCHHSSRDYHNDSKLAEWLDKDWYDGTGGKQVWNQGYPWSADFTHTMMHVQILGLLLAGVTISLWWVIRVLNEDNGDDIFAPKPSVQIKYRWLRFWAWSGLWAWLAWWAEGYAMTLWYHVILPNAPHVETWTFWRWVIPF